MNIFNIFLSKLCLSVWYCDLWISLPELRTWFLLLYLLTHWVFNTLPFLKATTPTIFLRSRKTACSLSLSNWSTSNIKLLTFVFPTSDIVELSKQPLLQILVLMYQLLFFLLCPILLRNKKKSNSLSAFVLYDPYSLGKHWII